jgi:hypothetical protein
LARIAVCSGKQPSARIFFATFKTPCGRKTVLTKDDTPHRRPDGDKSLPGFVCWFTVGGVADAGAGVTDPGHNINGRLAPKQHSVIHKTKWLKAIQFFRAGPSQG